MYLRHRALTAVGAVAVCLISYRVVRNFMRNDVTVYVTELVRLPTSGLRQDDHSTLPIEGKIEVETALMHSYRFSLKLWATVRQNSKLLVQHPYAPRRRVQQPSSFPPATFATPTPAAAAIANNTSVTMEEMNSSFGSMSGTVSERNYAAHSARRSAPLVTVQESSALVDRVEMGESGQLCFSPACLDRACLLKYTSSTSLAALAATLSSPTDGAEPCGAQGGGAVRVWRCFLEPDASTPRAQRLSFDVEFAAAAREVKLLLTLPSRRARVLRTETNHLGLVLHPVGGKQHCVAWDIGNVDAAVQRQLRERSGQQQHKQIADMNGDLTAAPLVVCSAQEGGGNTAAATATTTAPAAAMCHFVLVYELPDTDAAAPDTDFVWSASGQAMSLPPGLFFRTSTRRSNDESSNEDDDSNDNDDDDEAEEEEESSGEEEEEEESGTTTARSGTREGLTTSSQAADSTASGASRATARSKAGQQTRPAVGGSAKARKRAARAQKRAAQQQRLRTIEAGVSSTTLTAPTVELSYSTASLASGMSIRRLQVVRDRPNWQPRSPLDRWLLRWIVPGLEHRRLSRLAHYTTYFVQPVAVMTL